MNILTYLDENEYRKKERALRRYFMKTYKYLIFKFYPTLKKKGKKDGVYKVALPTEKLFEKVYGPIELHFSVRKEIVILENILPDELLISCFMKDLPTYKGVPYRNKKDLTKIKIAEELYGSK